MTKRHQSWEQWRRYRYQGLVAERLASGPAYAIAKHEAAWRQRIARIIGTKAALDAEVEWHIDDDGTLRLFIKGDLSSLTKKQAVDIQHLSHRIKP